MRAGKAVFCEKPLTWSPWEAQQLADDLRRYVAANLDRSDDELRRGAEVTIRNHDPCISCATHFLDLTVVRS